MEVSYETVLKDKYKNKYHIRTKRGKHESHLIHQKRHFLKVKILAFKLKLFGKR